MVASRKKDLSPNLFSGEKLFGIAVLGVLGGDNIVLPSTMVILCISSFLMTGIFYFLSKTEITLQQLEQDMAEEAYKEDIEVVDYHTPDDIDIDEPSQNDIKDADFGEKRGGGGNTQSLIHNEVS